MKQIWKIQSTSIFCVLTLVACGLLYSDIPTDDELIQLFENNPRCFDGLRELVESTPSLQFAERSSHNEISFDPNNFELRNNPIWEECFNVLKLERFDPWYEQGKLISIRYRVSSTGILMTGGQEKGYFYSKKIINRNIYDNLDQFKPGGKRSNEVTEYDDLFRNVGRNWYIYYSVDY